MPLVLIMTAVVGVLLGILASVSRASHEQMGRREATAITFRASEAATMQVFSDMSKNGISYKFRNTIANMSDLDNYTAYSLFDYAANNGLPTIMAGESERNYYPYGGGLLKNFGPEDSFSSKLAFSGYSITDQLEAPLPAPNELSNPSDIGSSNVQAWTQIERLDEAPPGASAVGSDLDMSNPGRNSAVRFRVTSTAHLKYREVNGKQIGTRVNDGDIGKTTIVQIVEIPPS